MTRPTPNAKVKAVQGSLRVLIAVLLLNLLMQPLSLGRDRNVRPTKDSLSRLDRASAGDDPANLVFAEARGRLAAENEIRRVEFTSAGMKFHVKSSSGPNSQHSFGFRFKTAAIGDSVFVAEGTHGTEPVGQANEVFYSRSGDILEKYRATERGVEQLIVLDHNVAAAAGALEITGEVATTLEWEEAPVQTLGALSFYSEQGPALTFGPVVVTDAGGRQAEVGIRLEGTRLTLVVDATWLREASYPLAVQSSIQALAGPMRLGMKETTRVNVDTVTSIEDTPVWRVQLRLETADITDGGTNNRVEVKLNSNNSTWLYSHRGCKPGGSVTYDLILDNVKKLRDIQMVQISKPGGDSWYIKSIALYVNGKEVYRRYYFWGELLRLGSNGIHFVMPHELRNHNWWRSYIVPLPPMFFSRAELEARIEAIVGDFLIDAFWTGWSPALKWDGYSPVVVLESGPRTIQVNLRLRYYYDVDVDVSFDLEFSCAGGKIFLTTKNLHMDYPIVDSESVTYKALLQVLLQPILPIKIQSALQAVTYTNDLGQAACPAITVLSDGSVSLSF